MTPEEEYLELEGKMYYCMFDGVGEFNPQVYIPQTRVAIEAIIKELKYWHKRYSTWNAPSIELMDMAQRITHFENMLKK